MPLCGLENKGKSCWDVRCDKCPARDLLVPGRGRRIYLDMDGVLADFDAAAEAIIGTDNTYKREWIHGEVAFWERINAVKDFWISMPMMKDAAVLYNAVAHLQPVVLTALPRSDAEAVADQKRAWAELNFGPELQVITCMTKDKPLYCQPGDVLVDDRAVNRAAWHARGGHYVLHTDAESSIRMLQLYGVL